MRALFSGAGVAAGYGERMVFDDLTFTLAPGRFYGLLGPNGAGKTTLIDLLLANLAPRSGEVLFRGLPLGSYRRAALALEIALVPQEFRLNFDFTVREVVMMGRHPHLPRFASPGERDRLLVDQALVELGIADLQDRLVTRLSGGEQQRVVVARALAQDTPVLMLDEATSSLDIRHSLHILKVLKRRCREEGERTIIAAIHDLNLAAAYCDEILLLEQGRLLAMGAPEEVLQPEMIRRVFAVDCQAFAAPGSGAYQLAYRYE